MKKKKEKTCIDVEIIPPETKKAFDEKQARSQKIQQAIKNHKPTLERLAKGDIDHSKPS